MLTLIEARPGAGKTTMMQRLVEQLLERDMTLAGFVTEEIREGGRRVGFSIKTLGGESGTLAHGNLPGPPRVGRYGVDIGGFERFALPMLRVAVDAILIDELGKMELASNAFRDTVADLVAQDTLVVATVHAFPHPLTDALKTRRTLRSYISPARTATSYLACWPRSSRAGRFTRAKTTEHARRVTTPNRRSRRCAIHGVGHEAPQRAAPRCDRLRRS